MRTEFQGSLDGLCGLYALANALRELGIKDRSRRLYSDLFRATAHVVPATRLTQALSDGLNVDELEVCARAGFRTVRRRHAVSLTLKRPFANRAFDTPNQFIDALNREVAKPRTVAILCLQLPMSCHWTVARRVSTRSISVRDSGDLERILLKDFGLNEGRHHFRTADTFIVSHRSWLDGSPAKALVEYAPNVVVAEPESGDDAQELDDIEATPTALVLRDIRLIDS